VTVKVDVAVVAGTVPVTDGVRDDSTGSVKVNVGNVNGLVGVRVEKLRVEVVVGVQGAVGPEGVFVRVTAGIVGVFVLVPVGPEGVFVFVNVGGREVFVLVGVGVCVAGTVA
jgi:hypothetical protein